jgi:hypothetical protein
MNKQMKIFARVAKVDVAKREVSGVIAEQAVDKSGEMFDYASSKPYFKAWSDGISKTTDGKSVGNVRLMHTSVVCGKLKDIDFRDDEKEIFVVAKVTDDKVWSDIEEGVYTGFSIGGSYIDKWEVGDITHYTATPAEVSIVDNPCMYGATYDTIKEDGASELRKFKGNVQARNAREGLMSLAEAEMISKKYKDNKTVMKSMYSVADLACALANLNYVRQNVAYEELYEQDGSDISARLVAAIDGLAEILKDYVSEEAAELTADMQEAETVMLSQVTEITKRVLDLTNKENEMDNEKLSTELGKLSGAVEALNKSNETRFKALADGQAVLAEAVDVASKAAADAGSAAKAVAETLVKLNSAPASRPTGQRPALAVDKTADVPGAAPVEKSDKDREEEIRLTVRKQGKIATPEEEAVASVMAFEKIRKIHQGVGIEVRPGDPRFLATSR